MLTRICQSAGAVIAAIWLATGVVAAPVSLSDSDIPTFAPASSTIIDVFVPSQPTPSKSVLTDPPQIGKQLPPTDTVLDVAGVPANSTIPTGIQSSDESAPVVDNNDSIAVQLSSHLPIARDKSQDARPSAAPSAQSPSTNFIARQDSSPLVIATPEPGSVGLLLIASAMFLGRRRSVSRQAR
jgi:hypothetical protein